MQHLYTLTKDVITLINKNERFRATLNGVRSHTKTDSQCDELDIDFEVIGLPQRRLIAVHNVEPITIHIGEKDVMPYVKVRDDFPSVSHLNILQNNITKTLCYSDLPYEEIKHKMSGRFLLTCIENWFLKTSMNELHRPDQPIEPFFPYVNDFVIWDEAFDSTIFQKFMIEEREFGKLMYRCDEGSYYAVFNFEVPKDYSNLIHNMPQNLFDLLRSFENEIRIRDWLNIITSIISNDKIYNKYFQQSKNNLLSCKVIINLSIPKSRTANTSPETYDLRTFVTKDTLKGILADYGLELKGSKILDCKGSCGHGVNISIQQFNVLLQHSRLRNKVFNNIEPENGNEKIAIIGVGAIGSHILNNFLREGYGEWTIIDHDYFWPHNVARHILTSNDFGYSKAEALKAFSLLVQSDANVCSITEDFFSDNDLVSNALEQADIIIDASTSIAVERHLALETKSNARKVSCFLNPKGSSTIMLLESADGKERLDLLEMQYYRELASNTKFADHMALPETDVYSGSCRDITSRISQDDISLSAALCSKALKTYLSDEHGKIIIWTHKDDSASRDIFFSDNWSTTVYNGWTIEISQSLLADIINDRTQCMPNETGGVLIGAYDLFRKRVYIVAQVKAPEDSISSPNSFIRGCIDLPQKLESIYNATLGNLYYIGEWHSHPGDNTQKSTDDEKLFQAIVGHNRGNCLPGCMMIVGTNSYSIFIDE